MTNTENNDGWIYIAKVNDGDTAWKSKPSIRENYTPQDIAGKEVTLTSKTFLHKGPTAHDTNSDPPGWRARQPVLKVIPADTRVKIVKTEINRALGGGRSVWASIDILSD